MLRLHIKKTFGYRQRNEEKRSAFIQKISSYDRDSIIYLDESGIRKNEAIEYGWSKKGQRLYDLRDGNRRKDFNIIAALNQEKLFAPFAFEGPCNSDVFETYLKQILKPFLTNKHVLVLDNASFHKPSILREIETSTGCTVVFLPPYSPDYNPIEHHWHSLKTKLRKLLRDTPDILPYIAIEKIFMCSDA